ncbi:MAG: helix-turn-helix domain-containing protein [Lentisphaerae bacterium]|nr:helix-turn-helix domain-containing protein [Lentisphaerota bacterium]
MNNSFEKLIEVLDALSRLCQPGLVWKATFSLIVEEALPTHLRCHRCGFCRKVKEDPELRQKCIAHDTKVIPARLAAGMKYLVCRCHAGVSEVVLPLTHNNTVIGAMLCGPFREPGGKPYCDSAGEDYLNLPELLPETPELLYTVIVPLIQAPAENAYGSYVNSIKKNVSDERIIRALDYIEANYKQKISLATVCHVCALSESRFTHLFREQCNISFSDYIQQVRIIEARRYLSGSNYAIAEIALICGFATQSHFTVVFKKICGTTPQDYRKENTAVE